MIITKYLHIWTLLVSLAAACLTRFPVSSSPPTCSSWSWKASESPSTKESTMNLDSRTEKATARFPERFIVNRYDTLFKKKDARWIFGVIALRLVPVCRLSYFSKRERPCATHLGRWLSSIYMMMETSPSNFRNEGLARLKSFCMMFMSRISKWQALRQYPKSLKGFWSKNQNE